MAPKNSTSPCISVCSIDEDTGYCYGCFRTLDEITHWKRYDEQQREQKKQELDNRRVLHKDMKHPYAP